MICNYGSCDRQPDSSKQRGAKIKKKLEIDPLHADTIRLFFRLALEGEGSSGQMGVKAIVKYLNGKGIFTRDGGRWGIGQVHRIRTRRTYIGEHRFNRRSNKGEVNPEDEVSPFKCRHSSSGRRLTRCRSSSRPATPRPNCPRAW